MPHANVLPDQLANARRVSRTAVKIRESVIYSALISSTIFTILVTTAILFVLGRDGAKFFSMDGVSVTEFLFGTQWNPLLGEVKHFGIWPLICGTFLVAMIGLLFAVPLGLVTAIYLSEYAQPKVRAVIKPALEVLAGIPTVVYGFFALVLITPLLKYIYPSLGAYNAVSAGIAIGILIFPIITSLAEDAMRAVPNSLRDASLALGGTRFDASVRVVFPAALSGIVSAILLAGARAVGETMIVALAAGNTPRFSLDPTSEMQTMTAYMVQMALGDVSNLGVEYYSMYAVAGTLFIITFGLTVVGAIIRKRYREVYQ